MAVRPQLTSGDSLDDFDLSDLVEENLFVETQFIWWWSERWFSGFAIGSDFDDTEIGLAFFLGYGTW